MYYINVYIYIYIILVYVNKKIQLNYIFISYYSTICSIHIYYTYIHTTDS